MKQFSFAATSDFKRSPLIPGERSEIMRVSNQMRSGEEPLDSGLRQRVPNWCFDAVVADHEERAEALGAVPFDHALKAYI